MSTDDEHTDRPTHLTLIYLIDGQKRGSGLLAERQVGESHGRGESERDGEPDEAARQKADDALSRLGRDPALPVGLVDEHRSEVTLPDRYHVQ